MRLITLSAILIVFAMVGCDSASSPTALTPEQIAKQAADEKEVENAENAMQKQTGGAQSKPKKR